ncbi:MAG: flagellar hook-associated protein FlgK [Thermodesulfobacteriota bacterium]
MSGVNAILSIAKTALLTQQMAIEVTSHNVANVNTPGYSRQQLSMEANNPTPVRVGQIGTGVQAQSIIRYYDKFMTMKVDQKTSTMTGFEAKKSNMKIIETLFNETTEEGLSKLLGQFWAAWHDLGNNPAGEAERATLVEGAGLLVDQFQSLYSDLMRLSADMDINLDAGIEDINSLTGRIADLNVEIVSAGEGGEAANDLRDKRNYLVQQLAELMDINYFEISSGAYTIMSSSGHILVESDQSWDLELSSGQVNWVSSTGARVEMTSSDVQGGKLGGWLAVKQDIIPDVLDKVNNLAESFIREVNSQHSQGIGLAPFTSAVTGSHGVATGATHPIADLPYGSEVQAGSLKIWVYDALGAATEVSVTNAGWTTLEDVVTDINTGLGALGTASIYTEGGKGYLRITPAATYSIAFSDDTTNILMAAGLNTFFDGYDSGTIALNSAITGNTDNIAAGTIGATGDYSLGDNENALALADLQIQEVDIGGESTTFNDYYNALVGEIGIMARGYNRDYEFSQNMVNQLSQLRDSISGVSLDEEMANLIKYQHGYEAAARLIQASDEMMQTLLSTK